MNIVDNNSGVLSLFNRLKKYLFKVDWLKTTIAFVVFSMAVVYPFTAYIFSKSFIDIYTVLLLVIISGLVFTPLSKFLLNKYRKNIKLYRYFLFSLYIWGGLSSFIFIAGNYYIPNNIVLVKKLVILKIGQHNKRSSKDCNNIYGIILYDKIEKSLSFPCDFPLKEYRYIELTLQEGLWGYHTIKDYKPLKK